MSFCAIRHVLTIRWNNLGRAFRMVKVIFLQNILIFYLWTFLMVTVTVTVRKSASYLKINRFRHTKRKVPLDRSKILTREPFFVLYEKCPDITSRQFQSFWMFQQFVFLCSYDLIFENQFCFNACKINTIIDLNQIKAHFLRKFLRKRLRPLRIFTTFFLSKFSFYAGLKSGKSE